MHEWKWPDWLYALDPLHKAALEDIDSTRGLLLETCMQPHLYNRLGQIQANRVYEQAFREGLLVRDDKGGVGANLALRGEATSHPNAIRVGILNFAQPYHQLKALAFSKNVICLKLLDGVSFGMHSGNLLVALGSMRSILEHVGQLTFLAANLSSMVAPANAEDALSTWEQYAGEITKRLYATRIDWPRLTTADFTRDKAKRFEYRKSDYQADMEAEDLLNCIDRLNQRVAGARLAYDVLCEFVHPNYGTVYAVAEAPDSDKDNFNINWWRTRIGMGFPHCMNTMNRQILVDTLLVFSKAFKELSSLRLELDAVSERLLRCIQLVIRRVLATDQGLFERNEHCPCGCGQKLKKCCGQVFH